MKILDNIEWTFQQNAGDASFLAGKLNVVFSIAISNEQYYCTNRDKQDTIFEKCKKQIKINISNMVFSEVISILKLEGNAMVKDSLKCGDYESGQIMREYARKLLLMVSIMEAPE